MGSTVDFPEWPIIAQRYVLYVSVCVCICMYFVNIANRSECVTYSKNRHVIYSRFVTGLPGSITLDVYIAQHLDSFLVKYRFAQSYVSRI